MKPFQVFPSPPRLNRLRPGHSGSPWHFSHCITCETSSNENRRRSRMCSKEQFLEGWSGLGCTILHNLPRFPQPWRGMPMFLLRIFILNSCYRCVGQIISSPSLHERRGLPRFPVPIRLAPCLSPFLFLFFCPGLDTTRVVHHTAVVLPSRSFRRREKEVHISVRATVPLPGICRASVAGASSCMPRIITPYETLNRAQ